MNTFSHPHALPLCANFTALNGLICAVSLTASGSGNFQWTISKDIDSTLADLIAEWTAAYCKGEEPTASLPISLHNLPPYSQHVLAGLRTIPFGHAMTYKDLAIRSNNPNGARAVGNACGRNPCLLIIPCHRVLASGGGLGGFTSGLKIKRLLLTHENIAFQDSKK